MQVCFHEIKEVNPNTPESKGRLSCKEVFSRGKYEVISLKHSGWDTCRGTAFPIQGNTFVGGNYGHLYESNLFLI